MRKRARKKAEKREDASQAAVRVINTVIKRHEGEDASLTDDQPKKWRSGSGSDRRT
jgi:hypothetical protein